MCILTIIVINSKCITKLPITELGFYFSFLLDYWLNGESAFSTAQAHRTIFGPSAEFANPQTQRKRAHKFPCSQMIWHHGSIWFELNGQTCPDSTHFWIDPFKTSFSAEKYYIRDGNEFLIEEGNKHFYQINLIWFYASSIFYLHLCEDPVSSRMPCTRLRRKLKYHKKHRRPIFCEDKPNIFWASNSAHPCKIY